MSACDALYEVERARLLTLACGAHSGDYDHPVFGEGPASPTLMLIGEAPGREESLSGHPFVGKAGHQLDEMLMLAGIERNAVFVTNAVKFRPTKVKTKSVSNRTPSRHEVLASLPLLEAEVAMIAPAFIATLGNTPLTAIFQLAQTRPPVVGEAHGRLLPIKISGREYALFPLYHPASGIYNRALVTIMKEDLARLGALIKETSGC